MTVSMLGGYVSDMPVLRAERLLDAAGAAHPSSGWIDGLVATLKRDEPGQDAAADDGPTPFRLVLKDPHGAGNFTGRISPRGLASKVRALQDRMYG